MDRLDRHDWPNKVDLGWNNYDIEVHGSRWSHLQITTVTEVLEARKQLIRCRLRSVWTLFAKTVFWGLAGLEVLLIGFLAPFFPWLPAILLTLFFFVGLLVREQRSLQRVMAVFLDQVAKDVGLTKVAPQNPRSPSVPAGCGSVSPSLALKSPDRF